jgi:multidrug transporter EmrE-like cation transporter
MPPTPTTATITLINLGLVLLGVVLNTGAQVALKLTSRGAGELSLASLTAEPMRFLLHPWFLLGLVLYAVSVINWLIVLSRVDLGIAYALMSTAYILTFLAGAWLFGEAVTWTRVFGLMVIILGVILITRPVPMPHG